MLYLRWFAASLILVLAACAPRYPLGIPETQWQAMNMDQRLQAQERQAALDHLAADQRAAEARAREREAAARQAALEQRRREARFGERVQCVFSEAEVRLGGKWYGIEPVPLDLVLGMRIPLEIMERSSRNPYRDASSEASFDGQTVALCRGPDDDRSRPVNCVRMIRTISEYRRGTEQYLESSNFLRGRLRCELVPVTRPHGWSIQSR